jgi:hypothetical protein
MWGAFLRSASLVLLFGVLARFLPVLESWGPNTWQGNLRADFLPIASVAFWAAFSTAYGLNATTLLMYHIMLQPIDFAVYPSLPVSPGLQHQSMITHDGAVGGGGA